MEFLPVKLHSAPFMLYGTGLYQMHSICRAQNTWWYLTNCVLIHVSSDSYHSVWPSGVQHNRGHTHHSTLSGQWSTYPRDHLGQGMYWQYLFWLSQKKKRDGARSGVLFPCHSGLSIYLLKVCSWFKKKNAGQRYNCQILAKSHHQGILWCFI